MTPLRAFLRRHRGLALAVFALALVMKLAIPAGFMPNMTGGTITVEVCNSSGPMTIAIPGLPAKPDTAPKDQPCAFAGLVDPSTAPVDPVLLVAAILFAFAVALHCATAPAPTTRAYLRPYLRGPPAVG